MKDYSMDEYLFTEKYRPKTVQDCVLPSRIKDQFLAFIVARKLP